MKLKVNTPKMSTVIRFCTCSRPKNWLQNIWTFSNVGHPQNCTVPLDPDTSPTTRAKSFFYVPHTLHRCKRLLFGRSRRCRLSPCWTWRRRSQSLLQCSTAYRCLRLHTESTNKYSYTGSSIRKDSIVGGNGTLFYWFIKVLLWPAKLEVTYLATVLQPVTHTQSVQLLLRLNWKRQELPMSAPRGFHVGLQVYFVVRISYHRQVSTAVFD